MKINEKYYEAICDGRSSDNSKQMWQRLVHHDRSSGASIDILDTAWPSQIAVDIGRFLYQILMRYVKIDTSIMRKSNKKSCNLPVFYTIFRTSSKYTREEIKAHPVLMR